WSGLGSLNHNRWLLHLPPALDQGGDDGAGNPMFVEVNDIVRLWPVSSGGGFHIRLDDGCIGTSLGHFHQLFGKRRNVGQFYLLCQANSSNRGFLGSSGGE